MTNEQTPIPGITNQRMRPPGILPKNIQTWVMGGVALLMVIIFMFAGHSSPKQRTAIVPGEEPTIRPSDADKFNDYKRRIEEESRKLKLEQDQLNQVKNGFPDGMNPSTISPVPGGPGENSYAAQEPRQKSWIEEEKEKRNYTSLFASNVVASKRDEEKQANVESQVPTVPGLPAVDPRLYSLLFPTPATAPQAPPSGERPKPIGAAGESSKPRDLSPKPSDSELNRSQGLGYRLFEGTIIETVLTNRLDGAYSGPLNCIVSNDVYSHDLRHVLIPSGSRVLGDVHQVDSAGQQRLAVSFHRLLMPDGYSVNLDQFHGLDQVGETGLRDSVNHHYLQMFGASIAVGMIAGLAQSSTQYGTTESAADVYRQGVANSLSQSSLHILDRFLNILPTFTIREGQRIKIYLAEDLTLPAYENHQMPSDL